MLEAEILHMLGVLNPTTQYWALARVRAIEGISIHDAVAARTPVRHERSNPQFVYAICHESSREHMKPAFQLQDLYMSATSI